MHQGPRSLGLIFRRKGEPNSTDVVDRGDEGWARYVCIAPTARHKRITTLGTITGLETLTLTTGIGLSQGRGSRVGR